MCDPKFSSVLPCSKGALIDNDVRCENPGKKVSSLGVLAVRNEICSKYVICLRMLKCGASSGLVMSSGCVAWLSSSTRRRFKLVNRSISSSKP